MEDYTKMSYIELLRLRKDYLKKLEKINKVLHLAEEKRINDLNRKI